MTQLTTPSYDDHESVQIVHDKESGLKSIIAVHDTKLGPSIGGCRYWHYSSMQNALEDALRLSKGMSYKNALAGLPFGGGKSVIIADKGRTNKTPALLKSFAKQLNALDGLYYTAEDVGMAEADIRSITQHSPYALGQHSQQQEVSGDPSPYTALGVYYGIKAAAKTVFGSDRLAGLNIVVQGLGSVGYKLSELLVKEQAKVKACDINQDNCKKAADLLGIEIIQSNTLFEHAMDIFVPCALGAVINDDSLKILNTKVVAGAANNQLLNDQHGQALLDKGIVYVPDYVLNSGGIIAVACGEMLDMNKQQIMDKIENIYSVTTDIIHQANKQAIGCNIIANSMAKTILQNAEN